MPTLASFLGWSNLTLTPGPAKRYNIDPPAQLGNTYWRPGDLYITAPDASGASAIFGSGVRCVIAGVAVSFDANEDLERHGDEFRLLPSGASKFRLRLPFDPTNPFEPALRFGPVLFTDTRGTFKFDANGLPKYHSDADLLSTAPTTESPIALRIAEGGGIVVNLAQQKLTIPARELAATLAARTPSNESPHHALFFNDQPIVANFADIAKNSNLNVDLALDGASAIPLNVATTGGVAPIEATNARLSLLLKTRVGAGSLLWGAYLAPAASGVLELRLNQLRNSKNRSETWQTKDTLPLAFRLSSSSDRWSSPLLAAYPTTATKSALFRRVNDAFGATDSLPMHSWFADAQLRLPKGSTAEMRCTSASAVLGKGYAAWLDPTLLQWEMTRPWLALQSAALLHSRPGESYKQGDAQWSFSSKTGSSGGVPLLGPKNWANGASSPPTANTPLWIANWEVNSAFTDMRLSSGPSVHETGLADNTDNSVADAGPRIRGVLPQSAGDAGKLRLESHARQLAIVAPKLSRSSAMPVATPAPLALPINLPIGASADFAVAWPSRQASLPVEWVWITDIGGWDVAFSGVIDPSAPISMGNVLSDLKDKDRSDDFPLAILKLSRRRGIDEILGELESRLTEPLLTAFKKKRASVFGTIKSVDDSVRESAWVGLIAFDFPVDYGAFPILKALVPTSGKDAPRFSFVAVSPRQPGAALNDASISAAIDWQGDSASAPQSPTGDQEATFRPAMLSVAFRDRRLVKFDARAELVFHSFMGVKGANGATKKIEIVGSARKVTTATKESGAFEIRFAASVGGGEKLVLFPVGGSPPALADNAFIQSAWLHRVEIVDSPDGRGGRKAAIEIDGAIAFQKPKLDFGDGLANFFNKLRDVQFKGLHIDLPESPDAGFRLLKLHYPSLKFDLDLPHIGLIGDALKLKFHELVVDWGDIGNGPRFDVGRFPRLPLPSTADLLPNLPKIVFVGKLDFGSLPDIFARSLSGFSLEGVFGLNFENGALKGNPFVGIGGFGFDGLNLDLASFLMLRIKSLSLGPVDWPSGPKGAALAFSGVQFEVLGVPVVEEGNGAYFSADSDGGDGFWVAMKGHDFGLFKFDWIFAGRNIDFPAAIPKALLTAPPPKSDGSDAGDLTALTTVIMKSWEKRDIRPATGSTGGGWTFVASIQALGNSFQGRALLQDGGFTGLALYGPAMKNLFNWDFVFVGIYRKNITPGVDYFYFSVSLPPLTFGSIHFTGGTIAAEIYTSGDFMVDFGFPWPAPGGGRQWERAIGAIITPGQAAGGFYIRKRSEHVATGSTLTIAGGVAVEWGLGAAFSGGVFQVWVRIGIYIIVEGGVSLEYSGGNARLIRFDLQGAAGILLEGYGELNWWVISVRVGVRASAEIRLGLYWQEGSTLLMPIEAELSVSASAQACIGGSCARICRSINVSLDIPVRYQLSFG